MPLMHLTSAEDVRLAPYLSIRERDLAGRPDGRFIVEGKVTLEALVRRSRFRLESVFIGESRVGPLADILGELDDSVPVYVAPQTVMDAVAGFPIHRGVLACAHKGQALELDALTSAETLLVLNGISNHDNVGAAFRNATAFGAGGIVLDETSCDPLYRKSIRVSAGSALWLPFSQGETGAAQINALQASGYEVWAMTPRPDAEPLSDIAVSGKIAILLGSEGSGLPDAIIGRCRVVRIPMEAGFDSINVATAGAIALSHLHARRLASRGRA